MNPDTNPMRMVRAALACGCAIGLLMLGADVVRAAGFTVTSVADAGDSSPGDGVCDDGTGQCTLRAAIEEANALPGADTITLTAGTYTLSLGELAITSDMVIDGNGAIVDANLASRVFNISGSNAVTLNDLTVQRGQEILGAGLYHNGGELTLNAVTVTLNYASSFSGSDGGGGIYNEAGVVRLFNSSVISNDSFFNGGGIHNRDQLFWDGGQLTGNRILAYADSAGGGLFNADGAVAELRNLSVLSNVAGQTGGGVFSAGWLTVTASLFEGNDSAYAPGMPIIGGGGIAVQGAINPGAVLRDVIVRRNYATYGGGGGICIESSVYLEASGLELYDNFSYLDGGGIGVDCKYFRGSLLVARGRAENPFETWKTAPRAPLGPLAAWPLNPNVILTNVTVYSNTAGGIGGGIHNNGARMVIFNSVIQDNRTTALDYESHGGGIGSQAGSVGLDAVRIENNVAVRHGGGIYNAGNLHIRNGTIISGNMSGQNDAQSSYGPQAGDGGGLHNTSQGDASVVDTLFFRNTAEGSGGGIFTERPLELVGDVRVLENRAFVDPNDQWFLWPPGYGGGIYTAWFAGITLGPQAQVIGNQAELDGGGIYAASIYPLTIVNNLHIQGNTSGRDGGGVFAYSGLVISQSQLLSNTAANDGGGIYLISDNGLIYKSTLSGNRADGAGGGIAVIDASADLSNTTVSGNSAFVGGGLAVDSDRRTALNNVTLAHNSADSAGANIYSQGIVALRNTIVATDSATSVTNCDGGGTILSGGYNLETGSDCGLTATGDQQNTDPLLEPLALNAPGNTWTHALSVSPASPALDAGDNATCEPDDQRSVARPGGPACDVGAFEVLSLFEPDLVISKSDGGAVVQPGETVTYTLLYTNVGQGIAVGVVISEVLPPYMEFVGPLGASGWFTAGGGVYTYSLGNLPPGAAGSVQFVVRPVSPWRWGTVTVTNTAQIGGDPAEVNLTDNSATDTTPVQASFDVQVSKRDHGQPVSAGGLITYTILYTNQGNMVAAGVVLTEIIPAQTVYVGSGWTQVGAGSVYTLWLGDVLPGQTGVATLVVQVSDPLAPGTTQVTNTVQIGYDNTSGSDSDPTNNQFSVTTPVGAVNLAVQISDGGISVTAGSLLTYTITFTNNGAFTATNVLLTFPLPVNTQSSGNPLWTVIMPGVYGYSAGTLAPGQAGTVTFVVQVDSPLPNTVNAITATVSIADDGVHGTDADLGDNTATVVTPVFRPTAVTLAYFVAAAHPAGGVLVRWQTALEQNTWGFHVWRSATAGLEDAVRITPALIPAGGQNGAVYEWHDTGALPGRSYFYWLQEVELDGTLLMYGPARFSPVQQVYLPIVQR